MNFKKIIRIAGVVLVIGVITALTIGLLSGCGAASSEDTKAENMVNQIKIPHSIEKEGTKIYKLKNGQWSTILPDQDKERLQTKIDNVKELKSNLKEGTKFVYMCLPYKVRSNDDLYDGVKDYSNSNADYIVDGLNGSVDTIDMRQVFKDDNVDWADIYYNTDHHWRPEAALYSAEYLMNFLNAQYEIPYNAKLYGKDSFKTTTYPGYFLGSEGQVVGKDVMGTDDFNVIEPNYSTNFVTVAETQDGQKVVRNGAFSESLMDKSKIVDDYKTNVYTAYTGADYKFENIKNLSNNHNGKKLLMVRDSYSCVLMPFLALQFEEITTIDLRHYTEKTLQEFIDGNDFDVIVMAYNPSALEDAQFTFTK